MQRTHSLTLFGVAIAVQLLATGCLGLGGGGSGGSGTSSLFNSGSGSGSSSGLSSESGSPTLASLTLNSGSGGPIQNPEPASVALFGTGLIGFGVWRRRKASKRS